MGVAKEDELSAGALRLRPRIARQFSAVEAEQLTTFANELFARDGAAYASALNDDELMAVLGGAASFLSAAGDFPRVRVFNPQRATEGWESGRTIIEACLQDGPFVVDTVRAYLHRERFVIRRMLHPVFATERERDGGLLALRDRTAFGRRECFLHLAVDPVRETEERARLRADLEHRLRLADLATHDQRAMRERMEAMAQDLDWVTGLPALRGRAAEAKEAVAFLRWLARGSFVVLGYWEMGVEERPGGYGLYPVSEANLGTGRHEGAGTAHDRPEVAGPMILTITPSAGENLLLPGSRFDRVAVQRLAPDGRVIGEGRFVGYFTPAALAQDPAEVPVLRRLLSHVLDAEAAVAGSHEYEEILAFFRSFPKDTLFRSAAADLHEDLRAVLSAEPDTVAIATREALTDHGRRLLVIVSMPSANLSEQARQAVLDLLVARTKGTLTCAHVAAAGADRTCLHVALDFALDGGGLGDGSWKAEVAHIVRPWGDRLLEHIGSERSSAETRRIASSLGEAFVATRRQATDFQTATLHIDAIRDIERSRRPIVRVAEPSAAESAPCTLVHTYRLGQDPPLSEGLPALCNFGLQVVAEDSLTVALPEGARVGIRTFRVRDGQARCLDVGRVGARLEAALLAVECGQTDDDALNALVVSTDMDWHGVHCLRTLGGYAAEIGLATGQAVIHAALVDNPAAAQALFDVFWGRFHPQAVDGADTLREAFQARVAAIARPMDARILAGLGAIVAAAVRTNFFRSRRREEPYIAIKIRSADLELLGSRRPTSEIYVHSARMEGLCLQSGRVTRGRITQRDRRERLRDGLLTSLAEQDLKNAMTVCAAAAGGFVVKGEVTEPATRQAYETLIRGILDLTDNRLDGRLQPAQDVRVYDAGDGHLVVADEPGSGFAGIANTVAQEYGLWLGDAFAAGSLEAYDSRRADVAARGAWECVRAHLRDAGRVIDDPIVVVGTGDMTDEVFGSAMLLSQDIQLRAAVSPRYVFLDPNPDPERSFVERRRLAANRLGWDAYDASKLSAGGMIFPRSAERVRPSPEVRATLGVGDSELSGEALAQAALRAQADVLWSGGMSHWPAGGAEAAVEAGAEAVDGTLAGRVEGRELRAAVVAEGGSGLSQRSRVDFAMSGGCINTRVIDGVGEDDLADHEVSLKLLFQSLLDRDVLSPGERDDLLKETADAIAVQVVSRIHAQHRALTFDQERSRSRVDEFPDAAAWLAADPWAAATLETVPGRDALRARRGRYRGLTRPELGLLLTTTKVVLKRRLCESTTLLDDPICEPFLQGFFPPEIRTRFAAAVPEHPLRREIIAAEIVNQLVDTFGCTFVHRIARDAETDVTPVIRAWLIAFQLVGGRQLVDALLSPASHKGRVGEATLHVQRVLTGAVERLTDWVLRNAAGEGSPSAIAAAFDRVIAAARTSLPNYFSANEAERFHRRVTEFEVADVDAGLALQLGLAEWLHTILEVDRLATEIGVPWEEAARHWYGVSGWIDFPWLLARIADADGEDVWHHRAARGLTEDVNRARRRLVQRLCAAGASTTGPDAPGVRRARAAKVAALIADIKAMPRVSSVALHVVIRELAHMCEAREEDA